MNKKILYFVFCSICILFLSNIVFAGGPEGDIFMNNISKIYIEFENGESQVIELSSPISYTFNLDEDSVTHETGEVETLISGVTLEQESDISRIALWIESFTVEGENFPIAGYLGVDPSLGGDPDAWLTSYATVSSWFAGTIEEGEFTGTSGVTDFNSSLTNNGSENEPLLVISAGDPFDASNKSVTIQFEAFALFMGTKIQTTDL